MDEKDIRGKLASCGLKVTPQRVAILQAIAKMNSHPTADQVIAGIKSKHPNISVGTVYKVLDALVNKCLLTKVKTENGVMRYDLVTDEQHHHLYSLKDDRIEDYVDDDLDRLLNEYFKKKNIKNFTIADIKLQITGTFH